VGNSPKHALKAWNRTAQGNALEKNVHIACFQEPFPLSERPSSVTVLRRVDGSVSRSHAKTIHEPERRPPGTARGKWPPSNRTGGWRSDWRSGCGSQTPISERGRPRPQQRPNSKALSVYRKTRPDWRSCCGSQTRAPFRILKPRPDISYPEWATQDPARPFVSPLQGLRNGCGLKPRALPWAFMLQHFQRWNDPAESSLKTNFTCRGWREGTTLCKPPPTWLPVFG